MVHRKITEPASFGSFVKLAARDDFALFSIYSKRLLKLSTTCTSVIVSEVGLKYRNVNVTISPIFSGFFGSIDFVMMNLHPGNAVISSTSKICDSTRTRSRFA
jgi:hypothetical protein